MNKLQKEMALKDLDELSIDNLQCGRITRDAMHVAAQRVAGNSLFFREDIGRGGELSTYSEMLLADELNDMLMAAREDGC